MIYLIAKAALSGVLIAIISEVSRRYPGFGGLIASLPLISVLAIVWLWRDTVGDVGQIAAHSRATLWYVVPSLPFFLVFPWLLEKSVNFWAALFLSLLMTIALYLCAIWIASQLDIKFE